MSGREGEAHFRAWVDGEGHLWQSHPCVVDIGAKSRLPSKIWRAIGGTVQPSINCLLCGLHENDVPVSESSR